MVVRLKGASVMRTLGGIKASLVSTGRQASALQARLNTVDASEMSRGISQTLKTMATAGALALATLTALSATNFTGFEARMSGVEAVTQSNAQAMDALTAKARELGESTVFAASQAGEGMEYLGRAGFDTNAILGSIGPSLDLAAAGALGLGQSADIMSNVMSTWNMHASESGRVADVMALASASANTNVKQLGDAFKFVGPVAASLKRPIEETAAAVGVLSDRGIQGEMAGTGLRRIYQGLVAPTNKARGALAKYGLTVEDVNPETHSLVDILGKLKSVTTEDAFTLFAQRGGTAFLALRSGAEDVAKLHGELDGANGSAERMAKTMTDNLHGSVMALKSAAESTTIEMGQGMSPALRTATDDWTAFLRANRDASAHLGERMGSALGIVSDALLLVADNASVVKAVVLALMALAFYGTMMKWAAGLQAGAGALKIFGAALGPVTLAIMAVVSAASLADSAISKWATNSTADIRKMVAAGAELRDLDGQLAEALQSTDQVHVGKELDRLSLRLEDVRGDLTAASQEVARWQDALSLSKEGVNATSQEIARMRENLAQAQREKGVAGKTVLELEKAIELLTERYVELDGATHQENEALELLKAQLKAANSQLEKSDEKASGAQKAQEQLAEAHESLSTSLASQIQQERLRLDAVGQSAAAQLEAERSLALYNAEQKLAADSTGELVGEIKKQINTLFDLRKALAGAEEEERKRLATQALVNGSAEEWAVAQERARIASEEGLEALRRYDIYLELRNELLAQGLELSDAEVQGLVEQRLATEQLSEETAALASSMDQGSNDFWQSWGDAASDALSQTGNALSQLLEEQIAEWYDFGDSIAANLGEALLRELTSQAIRSAAAAIFSSSGSGSGSGFWGSLINGFLGSSGGGGGGGGSSWISAATSAYKAYQSYNSGSGLWGMFGGGGGAAGANLGSPALYPGLEGTGAWSSGGASAASTSLATAGVAAAVIAALNAYTSRQDAKRFGGLGATFFYGGPNNFANPGIQGKGDLKFDTDLMAELINEVGLAVNGIVDSLGGTIVDLQTFTINVNNGGDKFKLTVDGVEEHFETLNDALQAGIEKMLAGGVISGISDNVASILQQADSIGLEGLDEALSLAMEADAALAAQLGQTSAATNEATTGLSDYERGLNQATAAADEAVQRGRELGLTEESLAALRAQRIEQYEAEFEALSKGAQATFLQGIMEVIGQDHATYMELMQLEGHLKILDLRRQLDLMYTMGGIADETLARYESLLARAEGAVTSGRYRGGGGYRRGGGNGARRAAEAANLERQRQAFRDALRSVERDLGDTAAGLVDSLLDLKNQRADILKLGMGEEFADAFVTANAQQIIDDFLEPFREIQRSAGESEGQTSYRHLRERYDQQIEAAYAANAAMMQLESGDQRDQHLKELLDPILAALEIEVLAFAEGVVDGLGLPLEQARDRASGLADQVELLTQLMEDGAISVERFDGVMGELSQQAELSVLGMAAEIQDRLGNTEEAAQIRAQVDRISFELKIAELQIMYEQYKVLGLISDETGALIDGLLLTLSETDLDELFTPPETPTGGSASQGSGGNPIDEIEQRAQEMERIRQALTAWREMPLHDLVREAQQMTALRDQLREDAGQIVGGHVLLDEIDEAFALGVSGFVDQALERYEDLGQSDLIRDRDKILEDFQAMHEAFTELGAGAEAFDRLAIAEASAWDDFWGKATSGLQAFVDELDATDPRVSGEERFLEAQARFRDLRTRAEAGDLEALEQLAGAAREYNEVSRSYLGDGVGSLAIRDELGSVRELIESNPFVDATTAAVEDGNVILSDIRDGIQTLPLSWEELKPFRAQADSLDEHAQNLATKALAQAVRTSRLDLFPRPAQRASSDLPAFVPHPESAGKDRSSREIERYLAELTDHAQRDDRRQEKRDRRDEQRAREEQRKERRSRRPQAEQSQDPVVELLSRILRAVEGNTQFGGYKT